MLNKTLIKAYIFHRLKANTLHGTHSPFIYSLLDNVVYKRENRPVYDKIEALRTNLKQDERNLQILDLGAGSHYGNNKQKLVKNLAKNALKPAKWAQLIYRLAEWQQPQNIIELGTCLGITTSYLRNAAPNAQLITIEGCPQTAEIAREVISKSSNLPITLRVGNFDNILPKLIQSFSHLDFVYFDGNHRKEATLDYFEQCLPKATPNSLFIFDDIHWSKGMEEAWEQIKQHPQVSVTVDLFAIGLVFFRTEQAKEHFVIRY